MNNEQWTTNSEHVGCFLAMPIEEWNRVLAIAINVHLLVEEYVLLLVQGKKTAVYPYEAYEVCLGYFSILKGLS